MMFSRVNTPDLSVDAETLLESNSNKIDWNQFLRHLKLRCWAGSRSMDQDRRSLSDSVPWIVDRRSIFNFYGSWIADPFLFLRIGSFSNGSGSRSCPTLTWISIEICLFYKIGFERNIKIQKNMFSYKFQIIILTFS